MRIVLWAALACLAVGTCTPACGCSPVEPTGAVFGQVVDAGGVPAPGTRVVVRVVDGPACSVGYPGWSYSTLAGEYGFYRTEVYGSVDGTTCVEVSTGPDTALAVADTVMIRVSFDYPRPSRQLDIRLPD